MVRALSGKRGELARCMAFCLEHAEAATEVIAIHDIIARLLIACQVSDIIVASLLVDGTPVPRKAARLHLICDILHNSAASVPSAWKFRQEFQSRLGIVFDHLANIYHSFPGRITAETFKKQITAVVDLWEDWIVFPSDFTAELRQRLEGTVVEETPPKTEEVVTRVEETVSNTTATSRFTARSFQPAKVEVGAGAEGEPMDEGSDGLDGAPVDDVDGEPLEDDIDGVAIDDDVDGVPMDEGDLDGVPIDDLDGEPVDG
jgi:U2-associated protein SR140